MSLHKTLTGKLTFVSQGDASGLEGKAQFDLIFALLSRSYQAVLPKVAQRDHALMPGLPEREELPFAVVLSFEERSGANLIGKIETKLKALFRALVAAATQIPGPIGAGATIVAALDSLLTANPAAPEALELKELALDQGKGADWTMVERLFAKWSETRFPDLDLKSVTPANWKDFLAKLRDKAQPAPAPVPAAAPAPAPAAFQFTQLMGWLTSDSDAAGVKSYGFNVEGVCRFRDNAVRYGTWARLDVFGPDGSQLLTSPIDATTLALWLYGYGSDDLDVKVAPTRALRAALATPEAPKRDVVSVSGRLWFSDGRPFGTRTLGIYVKPAIAQLVDDCCPPDDLDLGGCCGEPGESVPILQVPQALSVTQTDQSGYFEFSYASGAPLPSRFALIQVSGLAMPLALELSSEGLTGAAIHFFPKPVLIEVDSAIVLPDHENKVRWGADEDEECECKGLDFGEPGRSLDEFKADIVVRTTDPMVVRRRLALGGLPDPQLPQSDAPDIRPVDSPIERNFRSSVTRDAPVEWDEDPLVAQAVTISHGRILTVSQLWRADGYSLGDLRYSLPLAPLQKKNIAVIDWDRSDRLEMESTQYYEERLDNLVSRERDVAEIVNTALKETASGRSDSGGRSGSSGGGFSLGPIAFGGGSSGSSSAWSSSSQEATRTLAASFMNQLRDKTVQAANAVRAQRVTMVQQVNQSETVRAVTETVANRNACHAITVQYFEVLRHFRVDHELTAVRECLYIPLPVAPFDAEKALRWRQSLRTYLPSGFLAALEALGEEPAAAGMAHADENVTSLSITLNMILDFPFPSMKIDDATKWSDFFGIVVVPASPLPRLFNQLQKTADADRAQLFDKDIAPALAQKLVASLHVVAVTPTGDVDLNMTSNLVSTYRPGEVHRISFSLRDGDALRAITRRDLGAIKIKTSLELPDFYTASVEAGRISFSTANVETQMQAIPSDKAGLSKAQEVELLMPLRPSELADRKAAGDAARERLVGHLNQNIEFYHKAIWWTMDADRRFTLLDGLVAPNAGGRSVASVVENRLAAIVGNCIVMPVAPGIRLDYFDESAGSGGPLQHGKDEDWLLARYRPLIPNPSTRIAVPTRGVFAESMMGSCNGCEKIDDTRNWRYWEHPLPDEPTAIEPVSLRTRTKDTPVAQPAPMPGATVINQVASGVPQAPDPIGLASAIAAVANGAAFRDMTGLSGTQQNSRDALTQSYAATTRFGELGAELSKKQIDAAIEAMKTVVTAYTGVPMPAASSGGGGDGESVGKAIAQSAAKGQITTRQAQDLTARLHGKMVDQVGEAGGAVFPNVPEVRDAITRGGEEGAPISVSRGDTRVDIGAPTREPERPNLLRSLWPFGSSRGEGRNSRKERLPKLRIEIVTAIREVNGAFQVGEKSRQTVLLDCEKRILTSLPVVLGDTKIAGRSLKPVRSKFSADMFDTAGDRFGILALGQTASGVMVMPDIDYRFQMSVDPRRRRIRLSGAHDGFPSYSILVDGKNVYDFEQNLFVESFTDLMGTSDVTIDREITF